jgi:hypothetical protein
MILYKTIDNEKVIPELNLSIISEQEFGGLDELDDLIDQLEEGDSDHYGYARLHFLGSKGIISI